MKPDIIAYKTIGNVTLNLHIFQPDVKNKKTRTAILMFFCGGWNGFEAKTCYPDATYYASRGAVCFCTEVRVKSAHGTTPAECVIDAKSAVRWVRSHAADFHINPERIVCYGGSAAGHVSACAALIDDFNDPADDANVSPKPNAAVLFCPALVIYHSKRRVDLFGGPERARALSPIYNVKPGAPPMLLIHGLCDDVVVPEESKLFKRRMDEAGNDCVAVYHTSEGHGHNGYFDGNNAMFYVCQREVDRFLSARGFLSGEPTVESFIYQPLT